VCCGPAATLQLGEFAEAVECYTAAIRLDPTSSYAHYNRGITKDKQGDFRGAIEVSSRECGRGV